MARVLLLMMTRTYRAEAFLRAASRLGVDVTVGTEREQVLSRLTPGATLALDFARPRHARQQIVEFAERYPMTAVVGVDDDATIVAAEASAALGLPHNSVDSVKASRYKDVMRLVLSEAPLLAPEFQVVDLDEDPARVAARVRYPCVLKPLSLAASRGVIRADSPDQFVQAFNTVTQVIAEADLAEEDPGNQQLLVEDFIPGREVALEGLLRGGELTTLALFDKPDPLDGPYFEETIYVTPSRLSQEAQAAIAQSVAEASAAIGLNEGPIHGEVRLNEQGPWVVEVAARSLGGLCSNVLRFGYDLSLEEIILRHAVGLEIPSTQREHAAAGVMMIPIPHGGVLRCVFGQSEAEAVPGIEDVTISIPCGHPVVPLPHGDRYLGFIFARGHAPHDVESALRQAHRRLTFDIA